MFATTSARRPTDEAPANPRAGSSPRKTEDLQPRHWLFRLRRPDRRTESADTPRMDWLQALIVAGGAAVLAYHVGFRRGRNCADAGEPLENEPAPRRAS